jgi:hypothetical protein
MAIKQNPEMNKIQQNYKLFYIIKTLVKIWNFAYLTDYIIIRFIDLLLHI